MCPRDHGRGGATATTEMLDAAEDERVFVQEGCADRRLRATSRGPSPAEVAYSTVLEGEKVLCSTAEEKRRDPVPGAELFYAEEGVFLVLYRYRGAWTLSSRTRLSVRDSYWGNDPGGGSVWERFWDEAAPRFSVEHLDVGLCYHFFLCHRQCDRVAVQSSTLLPGVHLRFLGCSGPEGFCVRGSPGCPALPGVPGPVPLPPGSRSLRAAERGSPRPPVTRGVWWWPRPQGCERPILGLVEDPDVQRFMAVRAGKADLVERYFDVRDSPDLLRMFDALFPREYRCCVVYVERVIEFAVQQTTEAYFSLAKGRPRSKWPPLPDPVRKVLAQCADPRDGRWGGDVKVNCHLVHDILRSQPPADTHALFLHFRREYDLLQGNAPDAARQW